MGLALAAPAHARWVRPHPIMHPRAGWTPVRSDRVHDDLHDLEKAIDKADKEHTISAREAADLRARLADTRDQFKRFDSDGLARAEVAELERRINYIRHRLGLEELDYDSHPG
jgi:hypothetical protein